MILHGFRLLLIRARLWNQALAVGTQPVKYVDANRSRLWMWPTPEQFGKRFVNRSTATRISEIEEDRLATGGDVFGTAKGKERDLSRTDSAEAKSGVEKPDHVAQSMLLVAGSPPGLCLNVEAR